MDTGDRQDPAPSPPLDRRHGNAERPCSLPGAQEWKGRPTERPQRLVHSVLVFRQTERESQPSGSDAWQTMRASERALRPSLLLLDEPTEGIQPSIIEEIEALLQALRSQRTLSRI